MHSGCRKYHSVPSSDRIIAIGNACALKLKGGRVYGLVQFTKVCLLRRYKFCTISATRALYLP
jgi:hypothetical protein